MEREGTWERGKRIGVKGEVGEVRWRIGAEGGGGEGGEGKDWS